MSRVRPEIKLVRAAVDRKVEEPEDLREFRGSVARRTFIAKDGNEWVYFDHGEGTSPPVVILHGTAGTAVSFYKQVQYGCGWTHEEWVVAFDRFLDGMRLREVHLVGFSLGGFLAQVFTTQRPSRVLSLVLCNSFVDTTEFAENAPCISAVPYMPEFYLKQFLLHNFPTHEMEQEEADSVTFMATQLGDLRQVELATRITLNCTRPKEEVRVTSLPAERMLILDTVDHIALPTRLKEQLYARYPEVRQALLKSGGEFPFLSQADEVNLHLLMFLRRQGLRLASDEAALGSSSGAASNLEQQHHP